MTDQSHALQAWHDSAVISPAALDEALQTQRQNAPASDSNNLGVKLLRLDQEEGEFVYGQDNIPPAKDSLFAVNPYSFMIGWVAWERRKKTGEIMGPLGQQPAEPNDGKKYEKQIAFELTCVEETDDLDERLKVSSSSKGAHKAWDSLLKAIQQRPNADYCSPVVRLSVRSYVMSDYNKTIYEPVFTVVDWLHPETGQRLAADADIPFPDLKKEEAPAVPEKEQAADAPVIQRARRRTRNVG